MSASKTLTPAERALRAQLAAHTRWAKTTGDEANANGRRAQAGLLERFAREIDPEGKLDPAERDRRARHARNAHMARLALASSKARRARAKAKGGADATAA